MGRTANGQPVPPGRISAFAVDVGQHPAVPIGGAIIYGFGSLAIFFAIGLPLPRHPRAPARDAADRAHPGGRRLGRVRRRPRRVRGRALPRRPQLRRRRRQDQLRRLGRAQPHAPRSSASSSGSLRAGPGLRHRDHLAQRDARGAAHALHGRAGRHRRRGRRADPAHRPAGRSSASSGWPRSGCSSWAGCPSGTPKAWATGEAEPWPTQQQLREQRAAARGDGDGERRAAGRGERDSARASRRGAATPPPQAPSPRRPDPAAPGSEHSASKKKKRKRRS